MKAVLVVITIALGGIAHAWDQRAMVLTCGPHGGSTYMCSEAYTALDAFDAFVMSGGEVNVSGTFIGPGYEAQLDESVPVLWFLLPVVEGACRDVLGVCVFGLTRGRMPALGLRKSGRSSAADSWP